MLSLMQARLVNQMLKEHHLDMPTVKAKSKNIDAEYKKVSLCGRHATTLLTHFPDFLAMLESTTALSKDAEDEADAENSRIRECLLSFVSLWNFLCDVFSPSDAKNAFGNTPREQKAVDLEKEARNFVKLFSLASSTKDVTYYMRLVYCEIPRRIRTCPVDIHLASGMAGEQV